MPVCSINLLCFTLLYIISEITGAACGCQTCVRLTDFFSAPRHHLKCKVSLKYFFVYDTLINQSINQSFLIQATSPITDTHDTNDLQTTNIEKILTVLQHVTLHTGYKAFLASPGKLRFSDSLCFGLDGSEAVRWLYRHDRIALRVSACVRACWLPVDHIRRCIAPCLAMPCGYTDRLSGPCGLLAPRCPSPHTALMDPISNLLTVSGPCKCLQCFDAVGLAAGRVSGL